MGIGFGCKDATASRGMNRVNCSESLKFPVLTPLVSVKWAT